MFLKVGEPLGYSHFVPPEALSTRTFKQPVSQTIPRLVFLAVRPARCPEAPLGRRQAREKWRQRGPQLAVPVTQGIRHGASLAPYYLREQVGGGGVKENCGINQI